MVAPFTPPPPASGHPPAAVRARLPWVVGAVLAAHAAALWMLERGQDGSDTPAPIAPDRPPIVQAALIPPPTAEAPRPPPAPRPVQAARPMAAAQATHRTPAPEAAPAPIAPLTEAPADRAPVPPLDAGPALATTPAPVGATATAPPRSGPPAATASAASGPTGPAAPSTPRLELPSASAAYLKNPPPAYPALSRRLGEEGRVVLRVRIEADGSASAAEVRTSSGYDRLDQAALQTVLRWRYVPGTRNGVPEAMWFLVPIQFVLE